MEVKCKACGRIYEIEEKELAGIRPSSYLCPSCRDKGGKGCLGALASVVVISGVIKLFVNIFKKH